ncbi:MAG: thioesterase family protein [Actinobacteria bacterium]|jgi:acyl-CoA thioester hydrolase|nr:thioesterase family protein [Actinomycetota bacterium]
MRHLTKAHVRWDDLDGFGHVNNASYLTYIQEARANFTWYSRKEAGLEPVFSDMVVGRAEVDFIVPIYEGGFDLDVAIWVAKIGNSSFDLVYELSSPLGLHARGRTVQVAVSMETKKSRPLSPEERDFLTGYLEA